MTDCMPGSLYTQCSFRCTSHIHVYIQSMDSHVSGLLATIRAAQDGQIETLAIEGKDVDQE